MRKILSILLLTAIIFLFPSTTLAHRSGCHTLHTCPSDSNTYECGDLGYPCNGARSIKDIPMESIAVPLLAESTFNTIFGRKPTDRESGYWKNRFRSDKGSTYKIKRAMRWHKTIGSFGPKILPPNPADLIPKINQMFRTIYDERNPTKSENNYWITRVAEKITEQAIKDAMQFHRQNNIEH